jgi:hypothetical protein
MPWVKLTDQLHENDKILETSGDAVKLWVIGLSWANFKLTDGHIPLSRAARLMPMRRPEKVIGELLERRLWHRASQICKECLNQRIEKKVTEPVPSSGYYIHNYFGQPGGETFQRPRWAILAEREAKVEAGRLGGKQSAKHGANHGAEQRAEHGAEHAAKHGARAQGVEQSAQARTPVPRSPVVESVSSSYQGPDEPDIPDEPERSVDRRGTTKAGLRHISAGIKRAAQ